MNYYNEIEPYAAQWLRNLIEAGLIPPGEVDERSIADVRPKDLEGFDQCHFFAGIAGWPHALQLAGWPSTEPVWTGSCPCQPFSVAGSRMGEEDERHLWPEFNQLIEKCRPATVFGEQVASNLGRTWLAGVRLQMEALGYRVGAADISAACIGAPHVRQRLWWVANAGRSSDECRGRRRKTHGEAGEAQKEAQERKRSGPDSGDSCTDGGLANAPGVQRETGAEICGVFSEVRGDGAVANNSDGPSEAFWASSVSIPCLDGKARRIGPGIVPLAHGVPARVGKIRAYGNAIVPPLAAEFIMACR